MASRTPAKQQRVYASGSPLPRRHSLNNGLEGSGSGVLRKEQSSPAVMIQGGTGLVKQVVSASGQGCAAVVPAGHEAPQARTTATIWRTRSVRSKAESYCILSLKGASQRGVTIQVSGMDPNQQQLSCQSSLAAQVQCSAVVVEQQPNSRHCIHTSYRSAVSVAILPQHSTLNLTHSTSLLDSSQ